MMKYLATTIFFCTITLSLISQNNVDSLYKKNNFEKVASLLTEKSTAQELSSLEYAMLTLSLSRIEQYSNVLVFAEKMIIKCEKENDTLNLLKAFNRKAGALTDLERVKEGISFSEEKSKLFRLQDSVEYQLLCFKWGILYYKNRQYQKAYNTYQKITIAKYRDLHIYKQNLAAINIGLENYKPTLIKLKKSLTDAIEKNDSVDIAFLRSNISNLLIRQDKCDEALISLDSIGLVNTNKQSLGLRKAIYKNYFECFKKTGQLISAFNCLDSIAFLNDRIFDAKLNEKISELETSYSREKQLQHKVKISDVELENSKNQKLFGLLLFFISVIVIIYLKFRNVKVDRDRVVTEQQLLRSQMTPHFLFNTLSSIQGIILNKEEDKASIYLTKFSRLIRLILENSRNKTVSLEDEIEALNYYLELQNIRFENRFTFQINVTDDIDMEVLFIPPMIIQPFVENITEHAFNLQQKEGVINIDIQKKDNYFICEITDNGIGIDAIREVVKNKKKSLSTTITSERLQYLAKEFKAEASVSIQDRKQFNEQGTIVTLKIPFKELAL